MKIDFEYIWDNFNEWIHKNKKWLLFTKENPGTKQQFHVRILMVRLNSR